MYLHPFRDSVYRIYDYWGKKYPAISRIEAWHRSLEHMQDKAIPWIEQKLCNDPDRLPDNLAKAFKTYYNAWLTENRSQQPEYKTTECPECHGKGLLWFFMPDNGTEYEMTVACQSCENWRQFWPDLNGRLTMTIQKIIDQGFRLSGPTLWGNQKQRAIS